MKHVPKGSLIILSSIILVGGSLVCIASYFDLLGDSSQTFHNARKTAHYKVDIKDVVLPDTAGKVDRQRFVSSMLTSNLKSEGSCLVQLSNGRVYDLMDQKTLITMLQSNDRKQQTMALYVLMHMVVLNQKIKSQLLDATTDLYAKLLEKYPWSEKKGMKTWMIKTAFSIIILSNGAKTDKIITEAKKSDKKILEGLVQNVKKMEDKFGRPKKRGKVSRPLKFVSGLSDPERTNNAEPILGIANINTCTREELVTSLGKIMDEGSENEKYKTLNQLLQWRKYFKSEQGKEKRRAVTSLLMEYYQHEGISFGVKEDIVARLGDIGKRPEVRSFIENIANDDETSEYIRNDAEMALKMWDARLSDKK